MPSQVLVLGSLRGDSSLLDDLTSITEAKVFVVLCPELKSSVKINKTWFYVRGRGDNPEVLRSCDGIDIASRVFLLPEEGFTFSGISGYLNPVTLKLTRVQWAKSGRKFNNKILNSVFLDDFLIVKEFMKRLALKTLDALFLPEKPELPEIKNLISEVSPRFVFYPSQKFTKEKVNETTFIGIEPASSPKGRYLLSLPLS